MDGDIWYNGALLEWQGRELQSFQAFNELDGDYMDADYVVYFKYNSDGIRTEKITDAVYYFAAYTRNTTGAELVVDGGNTIQLYPIVPTA
ncbi:MAG: hypothetical protein IJW49_02630 [Clostridia bacterium]|nr:hypothetical protein [Clostridia bacterium]